MRLRNMLIVGVAVRLAIAPFFAHPVDVYAWYLYGKDIIGGNIPITKFLVPYDYSYFLFALPAIFTYDFLSKFIPNYTIPISSLPSTLNPGAHFGISVIPGVLFDTLVKIPLIISDTVVALLLYRIVIRHSDEKGAMAVSTLWFLNPLTIWISSGWGTFDTLPTLFTVLALYFILDNRFELAGISIAIATALKYYAAVLIVPVLLVSWKNGGLKLTMRSMISIVVPLLLLFLPSFSLVLHDFIFVTNEKFVTGSLFYSGLSIWTVFTLFFASFNQILISNLLLVILISTVYLFMWRNQNYIEIESVTAKFAFPIMILLLLYRFIGENFYIWLLPFAAILAFRNKMAHRLYWVLSLVCLGSSILDSLLPYYLLPVSPWIGNYLSAILKIATPFRVSMNGVISPGVSLGKVILSLLGIAVFTTVTLLIWTYAVRLKARKINVVAT